MDGQARLFQTDPSGIFYEWMANTTGRMGQTLRGYLEKNAEQLSSTTTEAAAIKHVIRSLMVSTSLGASFFEVAVLRYKQPVVMLPLSTIEQLVAIIKREIADEEAQKKRNIVSS